MGRGTVTKQLSVTNRRIQSRGFTLIELLIAVAILAIIVAIAVPVYTNQVTKTNRTEGQRLLTETAQSLERCFTRFSAYDHDECPVSLPLESENGWYQITPTASLINATDFTLAAAPQNGQEVRDADCGTLTLDHRGVKNNTGSNDWERCW